MGNRLSRKRDAPANGAESAATDQKAAEEPAAEETGTTCAAGTEGLDVVVGEQHVTPVACLPSEACTSECKEMEAKLGEAEPEPVTKETPAPAQPNLLVSISESSPSEAEPVAEPEPVAEAQLAPEPVPQEGPPSSPEAEVEAVPEPTSEPSPVPAEAPEVPLTDMLSQESSPDPVLQSPPLVDLCVPDVTPQPVDAPPAPAPGSDPVDADEPSDTPVGGECQDSAEAAGSCTFALEKSEEMSESLGEPPVKVEANENLEQLVIDAAGESISGLLQNLELGGNDLIPSDVKIPDDTPITDISASTDLI